MSGFQDKKEDDDDLSPQGWVDDDAGDDDYDDLSPYGRVKDKGDEEEKAKDANNAEGSKE